MLLAGIFAIFMQVCFFSQWWPASFLTLPQTQASRLGCVTGLGMSSTFYTYSYADMYALPDLASHCRLLLHNRPKHKLLWRWMVLYPLYVLSEVAIISTDLAELLGSAISLCMLFPSLPLWAGVLITASDVLLLLAFRDPVQGRPVRVFEIFIAILVGASPAMPRLSEIVRSLTQRRCLQVFIVLICMSIIISKASVHWGDAFYGFVPSKTLFKPGALYTCKI